VNRLDELAGICQQYSINILYAFGSRAGQVRDWLHGESGDLAPGPADMDIGAKPERGANFTVHDKVGLTLALEKFFGVWRVDLISLRDADPFLAANIIRDERLYASDSYLADEYDLYVLRRAGDLATLERERMALILGEKS
jgi:hypothetical protein